MKWLLCDEAALAALAELNARHDDRQIVAVASETGEMLVSCELVGDEYWADYGEWLLSLPGSDSLPAGI